MKMMWVLGVLLLLPVVSLAASDGEPIGRIGDTEISTGELRAYLDQLPQQQRAALSGDPALLSQVIHVYLAERMALKEAKARKFDERPEVKVSLEKAREHALTELYLRSVTKVPADFPSEAELQSAYEANKAAFVAPRQIRLAQIFVSAPRGSKASSKLDEVQEKLKARGADFSALARDYSDNKPEAAKGGEIGWLADPQLLPAIAQALSTLSPGMVTAPIRLDDGWHIVKLLEIKAAGTQPLPLAEVRKSLVEQMRNQKAIEVRQAYFTDLLRQHPPVLNELAISRLVQ
ncbi:peptidylprolyl isomerase [Telmatospirillum siberiense]|uniref:Parvulin-like PPIase n=1 Tax=Telmatospirillum siberiense TaxID=382514 RepID=A0A2N3PPX1_9PROT|nr:peptidylprolyl isomerase [Telmatospirillum siberiense]PKU22451.1 peptidylprolyl isomerase [Telmatospirillum siberiense]